MSVYTLEDFLAQQHEALTVHMGVTEFKETLPWCARREGLRAPGRAAAERARVRACRNKNNPQITEMKENIALLRALTPAERADPKGILSPQAKQRACAEVLQ